MSWNEKDTSFDQPPPYSPASYSRVLESSTPRSAQETRATHIKHIARTTVIPQVRHRAARGFNRSTIALVPACHTNYALPSQSPFDTDRVDFSFSSSTSSNQYGGHRVLGLSSKIDNSIYPTHRLDEHDSNDQEMIQIQLEGRMNSLQFWNQKKVMEEFVEAIINLMTPEVTHDCFSREYESASKSQPNNSSKRLDELSYNVSDNSIEKTTLQRADCHDDARPPAYSCSSLPTARPHMRSSATHQPSSMHGSSLSLFPSLPPRPKSFLSRLTSRVEQSMDAGESLRQAREATQQAPKTSVSSSQDSNIPQAITRSTPHVTVTVTHEDICLRTQNDFGLYETTNEECIVVRVVTLPTSDSSILDDTHPWTTDRY